MPHPRVTFFALAWWAFGCAASPTDQSEVPQPLPGLQITGSAESPLASDQRLSDLLTSLGVEHELVIYPRSGHNDVPFSSTVLGRIRAWYASHGLF